MTGSTETLIFALPVQNEQAAKMAKAWLLLGLGALLLAGFFAILLVLSRTPGVQNLFPLIDFFKVALIIHVNLSVLIWFLAFAGVFWSLSSIRRIHYFDWLAIFFAAMGMLVMVLTPFAGGGEPLMNNYVPILNHRWFFNGLLCFVAGMVLLLARTLFTNTPPLRPQTGTQVLHFAIYIAAISALTALAAFIASYLGIPGILSGEVYHELLFWGVGHVMQFTHTELMLVSWVLLAYAIGVPIPLNARQITLLFILVLMPLILVPLIYISYQALNPLHRSAFTELMRLGGFGAIPLGVYIVYCILRHGLRRKSRKTEYHLRASLYWSVALFAAGGLIGFLIQGANVMIPAHYHGCTVGVTMAFMGVSYYLLPKLGWTQANPKWAGLQAHCYGSGQLLHIIGLAWSGGYGVQRKALGAAQTLERLPEILGMGLMGLGGLLSILGGLMFLLVMFKAIFARRLISV